MKIIKALALFLLAIGLYRAAEYLASDTGTWYEMGKAK